MTRTWRVQTRAGHRLHAVEHAPDGPRTGPDLLLVHGLASNAAMWDGVGAALAAAGRRSVAIDQRGHGRSERAADGPTPDGVLDDLEDVVAALRLEDPVVAGQSWGGNVVVELAAERPGVASGIACVDGGWLHLRGQFPDHATMRRVLEPPPLDGVAHDDVERRIRAGTADWPEAGTAGQLANMVVGHDGRAHPGLRREDHFTILDHLWDRSPLDRAPAIDVPVLLLPAVDGPEPTEDDRRPVEALAALLDDVTVHWATGAHHDVHAQRPDEVAGALLARFPD